MPLTSDGKKDAVKTFTGRTLYLGLLTTSGGNQSEISGNGYGRASVPSADWTINAATGVATTSAAVTSPTPSGSWGTPTHFGWYDAASGGNQLSQDALSGTPAAIGANQLVRLLGGQLSVNPPA